MHYLFTAPFACFAFDEKFHIVFEMPFSANQQIEFAPALAQGNWIEFENTLIHQYPDSVFIGYKAAKGGVKTDASFLLQSNVRKALGSRNYDLSQSCLLITKRGVRNAFSTDDLVLQTVRAVKEHERTISSLISRLREWYELTNPEVSKAIPDNEQFVGAILAKDRHTLLAEFKLDAEQSMGASIPSHDLDEILAQAKLASEGFSLRERHLHYLGEVMHKSYPNIAAVGTPIIAGQLLSMAGSLRRLALMPASTIQLLGAERALFRHLKDRSIRPPKHGVIVNHPLMAKVPPQKRGKVARLLADKISIAARIDYFKGEFKGDSLLKDAEKKAHA